MPPDPSRPDAVLAFIKMQAAGNDFVVLDHRGGAVALLPALLKALADRRLGVGCDQVVVLQPASEAGYDAAIRFYNHDATESGACGNGTRCAGLLILDETGRREARLQGPAGPLDAARLLDGQVEIDMGEARLDWRDVPLSHACDTLHLPLPGDPAACSMGNPHATLFVADPDAVDLPREGARFEHDPLFAHGANVGFAQVVEPGHLRLRVWERGAGLTPACGSGACAAAVAAHRRGLAGRDCTVDMPGGRLRVRWREDNHVLLSGPAARVFDGRIRLPR